MNAVEQHCEGPCDYHESLHGVGAYPDGKPRSIYSDKFKGLCSRCTKPTVFKMQNKGWYGKDGFNPPTAAGGITLEE